MRNEVEDSSNLLRQEEQKNSAKEISRLKHETI